jgi:tRNA A37 threonylcarbamoyladenosine synthetase subunit TsaC/SUA5/YrdC
MPQSAVGARPLLVCEPTDAQRAAERLAEGSVIGQGFGNFYVLTTRADAATVRAVNRMKGRPADQVGSITVPPELIPAVYDWTQLPPGLTRRSVLRIMDTFFAAGPFGFRGPAAAHVPGHLTQPDAGVVTAQVIAPGYACPSNNFLARAIEATGDELLYITSANRSRHLTGADDSPAHWRAAGLVEEFGSTPGFLVLHHPDESAARARYPGYLPMSTTILGFHRRVDGGADRRPQLLLERHGSLDVDTVRTTLDDLGFGLVVGPRAHTRLMLRDYAA